MRFYNCSVFIYSTAAGHKAEMNLIVIVIEQATTEHHLFLLPGWSTSHYPAM